MELVSPGQTHPSEQSRAAPAFRERAVHVGVVARASLLEMFRRKDVYVVWMLAACGLAAGSLLASLGVRGYETFLRDIALTVVNFLSLAVCIWLAGRQMPEELSRRTLFPLLARPVRRFDVLLGKFLAVWAAASGALLVLAAIAWLDLALSRAAVGPIFWQYLFLRVLSFAPIAALTIALSLVLTPPATVILSGLLTFAGSLFARTLAETIQQAGPGLQAPLKLLYFVLPHMDLFDLSQRTAYNYPPIPIWVLAAMTGYAALYALVFLGLGELRFRRMPL